MHSVFKFVYVFKFTQDLIQIEMSRGGEYITLANMQQRSTKISQTHLASFPTCPKPMCEGRSGKWNTMRCGQKLVYKKGNINYTDALLQIYAYSL